MSDFNQQPDIHCTDYTASGILLDDRLAEGIIDTDNIGFCNNEESLQELTRAPK